MRADRHPDRTTRRLRWLVLLIVSAGGCSNFTPGVFRHPAETPGGPGMFGLETGHPIAGVGAESEQTYYKVREAAANNAVVLEVLGDKQRLRVLPLPADGKAVFVSNLLNDTGVLEKLGTVDAVLYRDSPQSIGGIRMDVKMNASHDAVRPESDYALRPGDRLQVRKVEFAALNQLISSTLGLR